MSWLLARPAEKTNLVENSLHAGGHAADSGEWEGGLGMGITPPLAGGLSPRVVTPARPGPGPRAHGPEAAPHPMPHLLPCLSIKLPTNPPGLASHKGPPLPACFPKRQPLKEETGAEVSFGIRATAKTLSSCRRRGLSSPDTWSSVSGRWPLWLGPSTPWLLPIASSATCRCGLGAGTVCEDVGAGLGCSGALWPAGGGAAGSL